MYCIVGHLLYQRHAYAFALGGDAYKTTEFGRDQGRIFGTASDVLFSSTFYSPSAHQFVLIKW